jgi:phosphate transport system substrate-binding protein
MKTTGPLRTLSLEDRQRATVRIWIVAAAVIAVVGLGSVFAMRALAGGPEPAFLGSDAVARPERPAEDDVLRIAGDGSALPLARALTAAYLVRHPQARVRVHQSIGSDGGIRATVDAAIDVGLSARPLSSDERAAGLVEAPLALDAVVFASHPSVPVSGVTASEVLDLYAGRRLTWNDGTRVQVVQRESSARHHAVVEQAIRGFSAVNEASDRMGRWRVVFDERTMQRTLVSAPGSIGLLDLGSAVSQSLPLNVLALDGIEPTEDAVREGRYPLHLSLSLVRRSDDVRAGEFVAFAMSAEGVRIARENGYFTRAKGAVDP